MTARQPGRFWRGAGAPFAVAGLMSLVAIALAAVALFRSDLRLSGTNSVHPIAYVATVEPGRAVCATDMVVPAGTAGIKLVAGTYGRAGPPLTVEIRSDSQPVRRAVV